MKNKVSNTVKKKKKKSEFLNIFTFSMSPMFFNDSVDSSWHGLHKFL